MHRSTPCQARPPSRACAVVAWPAAGIAALGAGRQSVDGEGIGNVTTGGSGGGMALTPSPLFRPREPGERARPRPSAVRGGSRTGSGDAEGGRGRARGPAGWRRRAAPPGRGPPGACPAGPTRCALPPTPPAAPAPRHTRGPALAGRPGGPRRAWGAGRGRQGRPGRAEVAARASFEPLLGWAGHWRGGPGRRRAGRRRWAPLTTSRQIPTPGCPAVGEGGRGVSGLFIRRPSTEEPRKVRVLRC